MQHSPSSASNNAKIQHLRQHHTEALNEQKAIRTEQVGQLRAALKFINQEQKFEQNQMLQATKQLSKDLRMQLRKAKQELQEVKKTGATHRSGSRNAAASTVNNSSIKRLLLSP